MVSKNQSSYGKQRGMAKIRKENGVEYVENRRKCKEEENMAKWRQHQRRNEIKAAINENNENEEAAWVSG